MGETFSFENIQAWQKAHTFVLLVYRITLSFPNEEKFGLVSQFRRAAVSIEANIAEGYKKSLEPDTAHGGGNQGDLNFSAKLGFTPYCRSIKDEYAKIIDDYFTMFG